MAQFVPQEQGMKIAITHWQGRISPVFDVAGNILLVDVFDRREERRQEAFLTAGEPIERARSLRQLGTDVLICGMLSKAQEMALAAAGIRVFPHTCGQVEDVLTAFLGGHLKGKMMPGCGSRRQTSGLGRRREKSS
jgi:predicted Fe-Mo cluster-binding NifX family protein